MPRSLRAAYWYDGTLFGGVEQSLLNFFDVCAGESIEPVLIWAGVSNEPRFAREVERRGVAAEQLEAAAATGIGALARLRAIPGLLQWVAPDLLHIHSCGAFTHGPAIAAAAALGIPALRTVHMPLSRWPHNASALATGPKRFFQGQLARTLSRTLTVSAADRAELIASGVFPESSCAVLPNGVPIERFAAGERAAGRKQLGYGDGDLLIGAVGRLNEQKGFEPLIRAMPLVLAAEPRARLAIVGSGALEPALRALASESGIAHAVQLAGPRDGIADCFAAYDVVAIPSAYEAQGIVMVEAMAAGRAIAASPLDCFREMDAGSGAARFAEPRDAPRFAQTLLELLGDARLRGEMGRAGRARAREYSSTLHARRTRLLYDDVLEERR